MIDHNTSRHQNRVVSRVLLWIVYENIEFWCKSGGYMTVPGYVIGQNYARNEGEYVRGTRHGSNPSSPSPPEHDRSTVLGESVRI